MYRASTHEVIVIEVHVPQDNDSLEVEIAPSVNDRERFVVSVAWQAAGLVVYRIHEPGATISSLEKSVVGALKEIMGKR